MLLSWDKSTWFAAVLHLWQNLAPSVSTALHFEGHALLRCNTRDVALVISLIFSSSLMVLEEFATNSVFLLAGVKLDSARRRHTLSRPAECWCA